jgi:hypothetical protein
MKSKVHCIVVETSYSNKRVYMTTSVIVTRHLNQYTITTGKGKLVSVLN